MQEPQQPPTPRKRTLALGCSILALIVCGCPSWVYWDGFVRERTVAVTVLNTGGKVRFDFDASRGVNQIMQLSVYSQTEKKMIWSAELNSSPEQTIYFSEAGVRKQYYPPDGASPRELKEGEAVYVQVSYQYDQGLAACAGEKYFAFVYNREARAIRCSRSSYNAVERK